MRKEEGLQGKLEKFEYDGVAKNSERAQYESRVQDIGLQGGAVKGSEMEQDVELTDDVS